MPSPPRTAMWKAVLADIEAFPVAPGQAGALMNTAARPRANLH